MDKLPVNNTYSLGNYTTLKATPIGNISFDGVGTLSPKEDITPMESLRISIMIAVSSAQFSWWDYKEYVNKHNLWRHFNDV